MITSELCSLEERNNALQRALASRTFARSEQLRAFLRYICQAEASGDSSALHEYVIGVAVLGRPEGYSPAEDSSVRTRAYDLRQKLEKLYSVELPNEDVQITVPKGTYTPLYVRRTAGQTTSLAELSQIVSQVSESSPPPPRAIEALRSWLVLGLIGVSALLGSALTWIAMPRRGETPIPDQTLAQAWGPLAQSQNTVLLSVATPLSLVVGPLGHAVFGSPDYPAPAEAYPLFRSHRLLPTEMRLGLSFSDNMLAVGTMNAALICASTLRGFGRTLQVLPDRIASVSALRGHSAILLGAGVDSETIAVTMQDMPLAIEFDPSEHEFVVRDRVRGTTTPPSKDAVGDLSEVYGLITVKQTGDDRSRQQTVVLSGITSVGVQGAAEFFASVDSMRALKSRMKATGSRFPASYQVVVRCRCNKLALLSADYYSHRIL